MKQDNSKPMGYSKSSSKTEVYNNTILPQETRKISNRQPSFIPQTTGETDKSKTKNKTHRKKPIRPHTYGLF